ncbi:MAG: hypothetical protein WA931_18840, partial [Rhodococcus sp. (in: high G+C Gram-positive bacteria)]
RAPQLWEQALADPSAAAYLDELDATVTALRSRGADHQATASIPNDVATRVFASLTAEEGQIGPDELEVRRSSRRARRDAYAAAGAAILALATGVGLALTSIDTASGEGSVVASNPGLDFSTVSDLVGSTDRGRLSDPALLAGCLEANGLSPTTTLVGSGTVVLGGVDATVLITPGSRPGALMALAVGDSCGPGNADTISRTRIG